MQYEKYELKIQKIEKFFKFIFRHLGKIITVCSLIAAVTTGLLVAKGSVTPLDGQSMEIFYGESFSYEAKAFMSSVEYEYAPLGSEEWVKDVPVVPGEYQVRAVAKATFGYRYGEPEAFTIKKKPIMVSIASSGVHYGSDPSVFTEDLVYSDVLAGASFIYNADRSHADIASVIIHDENGVDITSRYEISTTGRDIYTTRRPVTIAIPDVSKVYDGNPLVSRDYEMLEGSLAEGDTLEVLFDSSLTDVGKIQAKATYKMINADGEDMTAQYEITEELGYIEVLMREVAIKTDSLTVTYDAQTHTDKSYSTTSKLGIASGHTLKIDNWAEITNAGSVDNAFESYKILDAAGKDVTKNYGLTHEWGTLTVNKRAASVVTPSVSKVYDGKWLSTDEYLPGEDDVAGLLNVHDLKVLSYKSIINAGSVTNELELSIVDEKGNDVSENYLVDTSWGTLTIDKKEISITAPSADKIYDGAPLSTEFYIPSDEHVVGVLDGHDWTVASYQSITNVGEVPNTFELDIRDAEGNDVSSNYVVRATTGSLKIKPRPITITANDIKDFEFDGTDHKTESRLSSDGLISNHQIVITEYTDLKNVEIDEYGNVVAIENKLNFKICVKGTDDSSVQANYEFVYEDIDWDEVTISPRTITFEVTNPEDFVYDGQDHSVFSDLSVSNLLNTQVLVIDGRTELLNAGSYTNRIDFYIFDTVTEERIDLDSAEHRNNYIVEGLEWSEVKISPREIKIIASEISNFEYDARDHREEIKLKAEGLLSFHELVVKYDEIGEIMNAGTYSNEVGFDICDRETGNQVTNNYIYPDINWQNFEILKRNVRFTATHGGDFTYDGTDHGVLSTLTVDNLPDIYELVIIEYPQLLNAGSRTNEFQYEIHIKGTKTVVTLDDKNYNVTLPVWETVTIAQREIEFDVTDILDFEYDGRDHGEDVKFDIKNLPDIYELVITKRPELLNEGPHTYTDEFEFYVLNRVTGEMIDITDDENKDNYIIRGLESKTVTITPRKITLTPDDITDFEYDGRDHKTDGGLLADNLVSGHRVVINYDECKPLKDANYYPAYELAFTIRDDKNNDVTGNYDYGAIAWNDIVISQRTVKFSVTPVGKLTFDGTDQSYKSGLTVDNLPDGYELVITKRPELLNAGDVYNKIEFYIIDSVTGNRIDIMSDTLNYNIKGLDWETVTIAQREIEFDVTDILDFEYDGRDHGEDINFDIKNLPDIYELIITKRPELLNEGTYTIEFGFYVLNRVTGERIDITDDENKGNYNIGEFEWKTVTISKRTITLAPNNIEDFDYDATDHRGESALKVVLGELVVGHYIDIDRLASTSLKNAGTYTNVLAFTIRDKNGVDVTENYDYGTIVWDTVTIRKRSVKFDLTSPDDFVYNGEDHSGESDLVINENTPLPEGYELVITKRPTLLNVGTVYNEIEYYIVDTATGKPVELDANNYDVEWPVWEYVTISPIEITLTPDGKTEYVYDATDHGGEGNLVDTFGKMIGGHRIVIHKNDSTSLKNAGTYTNVLAFTIVDGNGTDVTENYDYGTIVWDTVTISKRRVKFDLTSPDDFVYDGEDHSSESDLAINENTPLPDGYELVITKRPTLLNAGTVYNEIEFCIRDASGNVVTLDANNYDVEWPVWETVVISKRKITFVVDHVADFTYDGRDHSNESGLAISDSTPLPEIYEFKFHEDQSPELKDAGVVYNELKYDIYIKGTKTTVALDDGNYIVEGLDWEYVTIFERKITLTPNDIADFEYDGTDHRGESALKVVLGELVGGHSIVIDYDSSTSLKNAGTYENVLSFTIVDDNGTDVTENYDYGTVVWDNVEIFKRRVTFITTSPKDFVYDGQDHSGESSLKIENLPKIYGYEFAVITPLKDVYRENGIPTAIENRISYRIYDKEAPEGEVDITSDNRNYEWIGLDEWDLVLISPRKITLTPNDIADFEYDGTDHRTDSKLSADDLASGHSIVINYNASTSLKNAGTYENVLSFTIVDGNDDVTDNYDYGTVIWDIVTIHKRRVKFDLTSPDDFVYDGRDHSNESGLAISDSTPLPEIYEFKFHEDQSPELKDAGVVYNELKYDIYIKGTETPVALDDGNYIVEGLDWEYVTIFERKITLVPNDIADFEYDGTDHRTDSKLFADDLASGHRIVIAYNASIPLKDAGTYENVLSFTIVDGNGTDVTDNYDYGTVIWDTVTIHKRRVTFITTSPEDFVYDGKDHSGESSLTIENLPEIYGYYFTVITPLKDVYRENENGIPTAIENELGYKIYDRATGVEVDITSDNQNYEWIGLDDWDLVLISPRKVEFNKTNPGNFTYNGVDCSYMSDLSINNLPDVFEFVITYKTELKNVNLDAEGNEIGIRNVISYEIREKESGKRVTANEFKNNFDCDEQKFGECLIGEVVIYKRTINIVSSDYDDTYDGQEHKGEEWNKLFTDGKHRLVDGHYFEMPDYGRTSVKEITVQTDEYGNIVVVGKDNIISSYIIRDAYGEDVTKNYKRESETWGTIIVRPRKIKVKTGTQRWPYDGEEHSFEVFERVEGELLEGHELRIVGDGPSRVEHGITKNDLEIGVFDSNGNLIEGLYEIEVECGNLIIQWAIHVYLGRNEHTYDGIEKTITYCSMIGAPEGSPDGVNTSFVFKGFNYSWTNVVTIQAGDTLLDGDGEKRNLGYFVDFAVYDEEGNDITDLYYIVVDAYAKEVKEYGKVSNEKWEVFKITPRVIEITTKSKTKEYDGEALVYQEYEITEGKLAVGDVFAEDNYQAMAASITEKGTTDNTIMKDDFKILNANGEIVYYGRRSENENNYYIKFILGTLEVT